MKYLVSINTFRRYASENVRRTRQTIPAESYKDAVKIVAAMHETGTQEIERQCDICVQLYLGRGTVLVPIDSIEGAIGDLERASGEINADKPKFAIRVT